MDSTAKVRSIKALEMWKASLKDYAGTTREQLTKVELEIRHVEQYLQERLSHWRHEVDQCRLELAAALMAADAGLVLEAKRRVTSAESELDNVRKWIRQFDDVTASYKTQSQRMSQFIESSLSRANTFLGSAIDRLYAYVATRPPSGIDIASSSAVYGEPDNSYDFSAKPPDLSAIFVKDTKNLKGNGMYQKAINGGVGYKPQSQPLTLTLITAKEAYQKGEPIEVTVILKNQSTQPITINKRMAIDPYGMTNGAWEVKFEIIFPPGNRGIVVTAVNAGEPEKKDFMSLLPAMEVHSKYILTEYYWMQLAGNYEISATYHNMDDGHRFGFSAWTGEIKSDACHVTVT